LTYLPPSTPSTNSYGVLIFLGFTEAQDKALSLAGLTEEQIIQTESPHSHTPHNRQTACT